MYALQFNTCCEVFIWRNQVIASRNLQSLTWDVLLTVPVEEGLKSWLCVLSRCGMVWRTKWNNGSCASARIDVVMMEVSNPSDQLVWRCLATRGAHSQACPGASWYTSPRVMRPPRWIT